MELTKINEMMANRGYTKPIGAIFSDWEFVKDEILLPNRKAGSGNGTAHVYLLEDNMHLFKECFPQYIDAVNAGSSSAENLCPRVRHFILTSNVITVAGFAYHHYNCDANIFGYSDFISKVLRNDDNGMLTFESLFKLSTVNRPYLKQFDKQVFTKLIRYLFVPKKTAYKLYMYGDEDYRNFAVFWIVGQVTDKSFIIEEEPTTKPATKKEKKSEPVAVVETVAELAPDTPLSPEEMEALFRAFMQSLNKSHRTIGSYVLSLKTLVPQAWTMLDNQEHPSLFTITNYDEAKSLGEQLWARKDICQWNTEEHCRVSAALNMYTDMLSKRNSISIPAAKPAEKKSAKEVSRMDFTLTDSEEKQKNLYQEYLKKKKDLSDVTITGYVNSLLKQLPNILRDFYKADFHNIFSYTDYKELTKLIEDLWEIPEVKVADDKSHHKIRAALNAYTEYIESTLTDEELERLFAEEYSEDPFEDNRILESVGKKQQYSTHLPVLSIDGACGRFAGEAQVENEGWVDASHLGVRLKPDMFVVHAKGDSMEPKIKDGDLCVFSQYQGESRQNSIVLTQLAENDQDYMGAFTIKKYYGEKTMSSDGYISLSKVELRSLNKKYPPIVINEENAPYIKTIGILVGIL